MLRVRRTPHGKSQLGPILVGQWQHPVTCATAKMPHGCIQSLTSGTAHANRKTNGNVTTPNACNLLYCERGMEVRKGKKTLQLRRQPVS